MKIPFYKYQGTGNDFIMLDDRIHSFDENDKDRIAHLCHRHFGIGADGIILIRDHPEFDFEMIYLNSDGSQSLCGNGSRCAVQFAHDLGIIKNNVRFMTYAGKLEADVLQTGIRLKMPDVSEVVSKGKDFFIDTGSPHHVCFVENVHSEDVTGVGKAIRYSEEYAPVGTNVNFAQTLDENRIFVRTYERGVEAETFSCGTGVTASALALMHKQSITIGAIDIQTLGGALRIEAEATENGGFRNVYLRGPALKVFEGTI
ncbi:MAG: diaminopimelate epimerase [Cyclobacteriaceae bacterium]|nr:diaminopimelate epimerase [Cyclobacteriaceae bacterium]